MDYHGMKLGLGSWKGKKGLIIKTWERCRSIGRGRSSKKQGINSTSTSTSITADPVPLSLRPRSKSWPNLSLIDLKLEEEEGQRRRPRGIMGSPSPSPASVNNNNKKTKTTKKGQGQGQGQGRVAPQGCFSVYVGPQMQRFVIKTEYANHPLFKMLLEEAESEYGYNSQGPLALPCDVDLFHKVLLELEWDVEGNLNQQTPQGCANFLKRTRSGGSYQLLSPSRMLAINDN